MQWWRTRCCPLWTTYGGREVRNTISKEKAKSVEQTQKSIKHNTLTKTDVRNFMAKHKCKRENVNKRENTTHTLQKRKFDQETNSKTNRTPKLATRALSRHMCVMLWLKQTESKTPGESLELLILLQLLLIFPSLDYYLVFLYSCDKLCSISLVVLPLGFYASKEFTVL